MKKKTKNILDIKFRYAVDLPDPNGPLDIDAPWKCVQYFETKKEAVKFCKECFGAKNGMINLISPL